MNRLSSAEEPRLKELVLWVTTDCNLRCRYCYASGGDEPEYMDWPVARRALDIMICQSSEFKIQFAGGEPLLNMDLIEQVVHYTQGRGAVYQLQTNATLIDAGIAGTLKRLGIDVGVSLDGLPPVNDPLRPFSDGQGSTLAAITGLKNLRAVGIYVGLTCVLSAENVTQLSGLVELASYLGNVGGITFDLLRPIGRAAKEGVRQADPVLAARCLSDALRRADELSLMGGSRVRFREVERMNYVLTHGIRRRPRCYFDAGQLLMVKPNGDAYPCASLASLPEFYLGNVLEQGFTGGLGDNLQRCRQLITSPHYCLGCDKHWICGGPCPAQTYAQQLTGEMNLTECYIKRGFINYLGRKEVVNHAANQVSLPV
ncbi:radical SAM protein [Dehalococcoidia bacterium]|nr:radical SAM protein [Dehalococcoidia bacterium]